MSLLKKPLFYVVLLVVFIIVVILIVLNLSSLSNVKLASLNPLKPHPGSCLILEEKYCKTVKFVLYKFAPNNGSTMAVYNLDKGATLFAPIDGKLLIGGSALEDNSDQVSIYKSVIIEKNSSANGTPEYTITFINSLSNIIGSTAVKKGDAIGTISDKTISVFGNYNLAVVSTKDKLQGSQTVFLPNDDFLKQLLNPK